MVSGPHGPPIVISRSPGQARIYTPVQARTLTPVQARISTPAESKDKPLKKPEVADDPLDIFLDLKEKSVKTAEEDSSDGGLFEDEPSETEQVKQVKQDKQPGIHPEETPESDKYLEAAVKRLEDHIDRELSDETEQPKVEEPIAPVPSSGHVASTLDSRKQVQKIVPDGASAIATQQSGAPIQKPKLVQLIEIILIMNSTLRNQLFYLYYMRNECPVDPEVGTDINLDIRKWLESQKTAGNLNTDVILQRFQADCQARTGKHIGIVETIKLIKLIALIQDPQPTERIEDFFDYFKTYQCASQFQGRVTRVKEVRAAIVTYMQNKANRKTNRETAASIIQTHITKVCQRSHPELTRL